MYDYIIGNLISKNSAAKDKTITVECNSIGYLINMSARSLSLLGNTGEKVKIYLSLIHKEDSMSFCGFLTKEDRDIFNILQSVSGIGVKVALVLLDEFSALELISAVIKEDFKQISRAKGVGAKMAQKIIIELKDKLINLQNSSQFVLDNTEDTQINEETANEVNAVLISLGYSPQEIKESLKICASKVKNPENPEELLKEALQYLSLQ